MCKWLFGSPKPNLAVGKCSVDQESGAHTTTPTNRDYERNSTKKAGREWSAFLYVFMAAADATGCKYVPSVR